MNILLINHYAGSTQHGMEYRPFYFAREWTKLGHKVTIVAASFSHLRSQAPNISGSVSTETMEGINYVWLKTPSYQGNGISRILNMLVFLFRLYKEKRKIIKTFKPDAVIASSTYPLDIFPAFSIAKKAKAKLIFEVHDLWPLSPIELGGMSPRHPFIMVMQWAENFAYRKADRVVSILPKTSSYMQEHGMAPEKFVYIPNGINMDEWRRDIGIIPEKHLDIIKKLKQQKQFLVCYAGAHGLANALDKFIEAAALVKNENITLVLIGQGPEKEALQNQVSQLGLTNVVFLPSVPKPSIPAILAQMDVLYLGLKSEPLFRFGVSPNKLMDYMMAAKPIIYAIKAGNDPVMESGCGISVPPEDPLEIAKAIKKLLEYTPEELERMGLKGRKYVEINHDYTVLAKQFIEVMKR